MSADRALACVELFTGAGGLALGLTRAGFHHRALIELDRHSVKTLNANRRLIGFDERTEIAATDVVTVDWRDYAGRADLVAGGVPCQPFSLGGKHRGHQDQRNLFPWMIRAVRETRPAAVLIENVKGLLRPSFRRFFDYVLRQLEMPELVARDGEPWEKHDARLVVATGTYERAGGLTYRVKPALIQAADYGIPQMRERVFIVAYRSDLGESWRSPVVDAAGDGLLHTEDALLYAQYVSGAYWDEHDLPQPRSIPPMHRARAIDVGSRLLAPTERRWRTVRDALRGLEKPTQGKAGLGVADHVANPGARKYPGHDGSPLDWPAKTLKAGVHGVPGGENMLRYANGEVRYFTVREAARLQTFPDEYRFPCGWGESFRQLGNAVPVQLACVIGQQIADVLRRSANAPQRAEGVSASV